MINGCEAGFFLGSDEVAGLNTITNPYTSESLDVTVFSSNCVREFLAGLISGTITISGFYEVTDTAGQVAMFTAFLARTKLTTTQKPKILWNGTNGIEADGIITNYEVGAQVGQIISFSATIQLSGAPTVLT